MLLLAGLLLSSTAASAAGPPTIGLGEPTGSLSTINLERVPATIKSNGASTTYKLEYGLTEKLGTTIEGTVKSEEEVVKPEPFGVLPGASYSYRFTATNSFGTVSSAISSFHPDLWIASAGTVTWPSEFVSSGSFTFEIPAIKAVVPCAEHGYGSIGSRNEATDSITMMFSECSVTGAPACHVEPFTMNLNGGLTAALTYLSFTGAECGLGGYKMALTPTLTISYHSALEVAPNYTFAGNFQYGSWAGYIKGSSTWELAGANKGKAFRWLKWQG